MKYTTLLYSMKMTDPEALEWERLLWAYGGHVKDNWNRDPADREHDMVTPLQGPIEDLIIEEVDDGDERPTEPTCDSMTIHVRETGWELLHIDKFCKLVSDDSGNDLCLYTIAINLSRNMPSGESFTEDRLIDWFLVSLEQGGVLSLDYVVEKLNACLVSGK